MSYPVVNIGFYNYILTDHIVAFIDYRINSVKKLMRTVKDKNPLSIIDVTRGRKALTLVVLTGDRYAISAISRKNLINRLGKLEEPSDGEN